MTGFRPAQKNQKNEERADERIQESAQSEQVKVYGTPSVISFE